MLPLLFGHWTIPGSAPGRNMAGSARPETRQVQSLQIAWQAAPAVTQDRYMSKKKKRNFRADKLDSETK